MSKKDVKACVEPAGQAPERSRCELCSRQFVSAATGYWSWRLCNEYGLGVCLCVGCASWLESVPVDVALQHLRVTFSAARPCVQSTVIDKALEAHIKAIVDALKDGVARLIKDDDPIDSRCAELADGILHAIGDRARAEVAERVAWGIIDDDVWRDRVLDALRVRLERLRKSCGIN